MKRICFAVLGFGLAVGSPGSPGVSEAVRITIGESVILRVGSSHRVVVANPTVADVQAVGEREILVSGRSAGSTELILLTEGGERETRPIHVSIRNLKKSMVEVGVEILEMETQSALKAGLAWGSLASPDPSSLAPNNVTVSEGPSPPLLAFGSAERQALSASLQLLIDRGKARILAKPKLLAVSGEEARFLAGGEIPYVLEGKLGSPNVEWKPYGVELRIKPSVDGEGNISAHLRAEVSGVDIQKGIPLGPGVVPALRTRRAETTVYMRSGSTLVIAGLINEENQKFTSGIPLLSDIPVLGELFRYTDDRKTQTELVVFVTPSVVGGTRSNYNE